MKRITLVLGTAREDRKSERVFTYLHSLLTAHNGAACTTVDVRDHVTAAVTVPPWGSGGVKTHPTPWQSIANQTDAFIFVLPEYNHGYPGEWKLLIDTLYTEYKGKDAYIVGVSDGTFSGVRVADHVKPVLVEVGLILHKTALYIGHVDEVFDETGNVHEESVQKRALKFIEAVCTP